jgi:hypothetical protein
MGPGQHGSGDRPHHPSSLGELPEAAALPLGRKPRVWADFELNPLWLGERPVDEAVASIL